MNQPLNFRDADVLDQAMSDYLLGAVAAKRKTTNIKTNMECRRKLEIKKEELRLARELSEYEFN
jgi:hypothetical protein